MGMIWEIGFFEFVLVTVLLGGGAAWMTGRAVAIGWGSTWLLAFYLLLLSLAVRFIHFALFEGTLISPWFWLVDLAVLLGIGFAGMTAKRREQMGRQYRFLRGA